MRKIMYFKTAPSPTEFKDIKSFFHCHHKKKVEEREKRVQWKITSYFTLIKKECNYDSDDEMNSRSPTAPLPTLDSDDNMRHNRSYLSTTHVKRKSPIINPSLVNISPANKSPDGKRSPANKSPGTVNRLVGLMPPGTFIPISSTFCSTQDACEHKKEVSRNLSSTFDEPSTSSKMQQEEHKIVIQPTQTSGIRISDVDNDPGVLVHKETQTDGFKQNVESQEVQTPTYKFEETGVQTEQTTKSLEETGVQTEETTKSIISLYSQTEESTQNITSSYMQTEDESMNLVSSYMQTNPIENNLEDKEIQTEEIKDCKALKMDIVQQNQTVQTANSCINEKDEETMTDIDNGNILMVNKIEIVDKMETWGTQTDTLELASMSPFYTFKTDDSEDGSEVVESTMTNQIGDTGEMDSVILSVSKADDVQKTQTQSAGLDMRVGEYREVQFPPVATTVVTQKPLEMAKCRSPSPVNLCTTTKPPQKTKFHKAAEKMPTSCTVSEDPRDVLRYVSNSTPMQLKLTPAHHSVEASMHSPTSNFNISDRRSIGLPPADLTLHSNSPMKASEQVGRSPLQMKSANTSPCAVDIRLSRKRTSSLISDYGKYYYNSSPVKSQKTSQFQFGIKSPFTSAPAISALHGNSMYGQDLGGNFGVSNTNRSQAQSCILALTRFLDNRQEKLANINQFCKLFKTASTVSRERKESNVVNWNSKMLHSFGHSNEGDAPLRKTSEHDSVIFTGYDSPPHMNQPDGTKKESSNKLSKNLKSSKGTSSEDNFEDDLDLSMEDDGDNADIDQHEEGRLLDDEQDLINPGKRKIFISALISKHHIGKYLGKVMQKMKLMRMC